jgi:hypothetical protein
MKGKLIKKYGEFVLLKGDIIIASSDKNFNGEFYLSKQNCDEIFGVVNLDQIKIDYINQELKGCDEETREKYYSFAEYDGEIYIRGIEKGMELNKDKIFTLDQMHKAIRLACSDYSGNIIDEVTQQPTEIDVEIEMECKIGCDNFIFNGDKSICCGNKIKKLDSEGNLILRKL